MRHNQLVPAGFSLFVKINKNPFPMSCLVFHNSLFLALQPLWGSRGRSGGPGTGFAPGRGVQGLVLIPVGTGESPDL